MLMLDVYKTIKRFCLLALNDNEFHIISEHQFSPRTKKPFISINMVDCKNVTIYCKKISNDGLKTYELLKTVNVVFNCYTDSHITAEEYLLTIYNMLETELTFDVFGNELAYLNTVRDVTNVSKMVSDKIENRALMELKFNVAQSAGYNVGIIEEVQMTNDIRNIN